MPAATRSFTAIIEREDDGYVATCPELDIASQGDTVADARANLREAIELFLESASPEEIEQRLSGEVYVTHIEVAGTSPRRLEWSRGLRNPRHP